MSQTDDTHWIPKANTPDSVPGGRIVISARDCTTPGKQFAALVHELLGGPVPYRLRGMTEWHDPGLHNIATVFELCALASVAPSELTFAHAQERLRWKRDGASWAKELNKLVSFVCECERGTMENQEHEPPLYVDAGGWFDLEKVVVAGKIHCVNRAITSQSTFSMAYYD